MNVGTDLWGNSKANHTTAKNGPPLLTRVVADYQQQWTTYATHWTRIATLAKDHGKTWPPNLLRVAPIGVAEIAAIHCFTRWTDGGKPMYSFFFSGMADALRLGPYIGRSR